MKKPQAFLFDLDGVLIDSEGGYSEFWGEMNRRFAPHEPDLARRIKGTTLPSILSTYFPDAAVQAEIRRLLSEYEDHMPYTLYPGTLDALRELRSRGICRAIVTSSGRAKMDRLLDALPELNMLIDVLVTDEDVSRSKPDPEPYLKAADLLGADPRKCVVVEDSLNGLRSGRAAGAYVVGIATTNPREAIAPLSDAVVDTVADVCTVLDK